MNRFRAGWLATLALLGVLLTACSTAYAPTPLPTPTSSAAATTATSPTSAAPPVTCDNATTSYAALSPLPAAASVGGRLGEIAKRGYLVAGVSSDSLLLGSRNPLTGAIEGFDIDICLLYTSRCV